MLDDLTLAMLGNQEAQNRITDRGELLPCPYCGGNGIKRGFDKSGVKWITCGSCYCDGPTHETKKGAIGSWNTRTAILTSQQLKKLGEAE